VRGLHEQGSRAGVGFGAPLFRGSLEGGAEQWRELLAAFGLREEPAGAVRELPAERSPTLEGLRSP